MRVVHVHRVMGVGGSERHLLTLLPALRDRGVDARLVGLDVGSPDPFYGQLDALGVPHTRLDAPRDLDPVLAYRLRQALRSSRPDVVHTHLVHADVYGAVAAGLTPIVSTKHNDDPFRRGPFRYVERLLARRTARTICITDALAHFNIDEVGIPPGKITVIHYGLDHLPAAWGPPGGPDLPEGARVLLAISRLERQKGIDVAIEALALVQARHADAVLVVLGRGGLEQELLELAQQRGVRDRVYLPGSVGDVAVWLRRAEIFVHPARWEGFGLALLEAMLAELPVVASEVSSIPEIVLDGETGLLVPLDDAVGLADAVEALLADPVRAQTLGEAGRTRALERFSVSRMVDHTIAVYERAKANR